MDFSQLKQFNPKRGERYIFIENGRPIFVILPYEDYEFFKTGQTQNPNNPGRDVQDKEAAKELSFKDDDFEPGEDDLTVQDLPF